jgi:hypothetical protein
MKKASGKADELRPEYSREDFGAMVRGKYAARARESSNVVVIEPDVSKAFPNSDAVNEALRGLLAIAKAATAGARQSRRAARKQPAA